MANKCDVKRIAELAEEDQVSHLACCICVHFLKTNLESPDAHLGGILVLLVITCAERLTTPGHWLLNDRISGQTLAFFETML